MSVGSCIRVLSSLTVSEMGRPSMMALISRSSSRLVLEDASFRVDGVVAVGDTGAGGAGAGRFLRVSVEPGESVLYVPGVLERVSVLIEEDAVSERSSDSGGGGGARLLPFTCTYAPARRSLELSLTVRRWRRAVVGSPGSC